MGGILGIWSWAVLSVFFEELPSVLVKLTRHRRECTDTDYSTLIVFVSHYYVLHIAVIPLHSTCTHSI